MAGRGPAPKPAHLRSRRHRKAGSGTLAFPTATSVPTLPNPDGRSWHPLTEEAWKRAWISPMAAEWLPTDGDALGRLALLWDSFYKTPDAKLLAEIRLQESRFGLSPLDRSRLSWEIARGEEAERKQRPEPTAPKKRARDPRSFLRSLK